MNTLQQIQALQKQLELETACAALLQSDTDLSVLLAKHKSRIHQMLEKPLYTCICWLTFPATPELLNDIECLYPRIIENLSGSGVWRYTSVPDTEEAKAVVLNKDSKTEFRRKTQAVAETSSSGTEVSFYILVDNKPVKINIDFSYQSRDFVVPHLTENHNYKKDGSNGKKYKGFNGAGDSDSCIGVYSFGSLDQLLPKQRG